MKRAIVILLVVSLLGCGGCGTVLRAAAWNTARQGDPAAGAVLWDAGNAMNHYQQQLPPEQRVASDLTGLAILGLMGGR